MQQHSTPQSPRDRTLPNQRWQIYPSQAQQAENLAQEIGLSPLLAQVLINRGIESAQGVQAFLEPELEVLPPPMQDFPDLAMSVELLHEAISQGQKIAICGDYDADGMTSTALLLRSLKTLGAKVDYAIPSRMREGYGINERIVEEFKSEGVSLILTVDNGIAAYQPIARARELGLNVIITDHHDIPPQLPPANAILNPKLISESSPYRGVAGVGVAYILAISLAQRMDKMQGLVNPMLELFTLGTIADLAPLIGVNRRWVKRGLRLLPHSQLAGVQALIEVSGLASGNKANNQNLSAEDSKPQSVASKTKQSKNSLKPEDIGFRLGPRINAIGRISDPQIVIELLTTDDLELALERAKQCEEINQRRQELCQEIEAEAIAYCEENQIDLQQERVLVVVQPGWHHGVIGIVASRLVERYGVPVFIGTYEDEEEEDEESLAPNKLSINGEDLSDRIDNLSIKSVAKKIRGSARGIPEFHVFEALQFCDSLLGKYGGHKAAGGFSLPGANLEEFRTQLGIFARKSLELQHLKPLVSIDAQANFAEINLDLYRQIDALQPCGIENKAPVFWTPNVRIIEQATVGKEKAHIKVTFSQDVKSIPNLKAIAWRWGEYFPLPPRVDIAYHLRENTYNGNTTVELELVGVRLPTDTPSLPPSPQKKAQDKAQDKAEFYYGDREYTCSLSQVENVKELRIRNAQGQVLAVKQGEKTGLLGRRREDAIAVDVSQPFFYNLIKAALSALEFAKEKVN
ncbi:DHH family phosphoesterase [Kamptonema sp. UHCC 0994]|uniref:single-stranded-DNA-specific exonuclease RecJ n=1 Tax=Kamptonema sp. UHCC 0994 TaxID=3031329 RepID=UPI0023B9D199|nr:DHH family phosphoesterase [Kamptonema sp. UHCC 0994]MDF0552353.1 DHH family phosphoesterase [Kamptonema sp. UHCC 0994]